MININFLHSSRHADKYVRRGRLDWPDGATSRESLKTVLKLHRLQVFIFVYVLFCVMNLSNIWIQHVSGLLFLSFQSSQNLIMQHVDHSAGDLIHLLQGLLRYDPIDRLTAREALRHPFFSRDQFRRWAWPWVAWGSEMNTWDNASFCFTGKIF